MAGIYNDRKSLKDLIIINGCTRGLGLAIVGELLNSQDYDILCIVRDKNSLGNLQDYKSLVEVYECDYRDVEKAGSTDRFFNDYLKNYSQEIYLINNLSLVTPIGTIGSLKPRDILDSITINMSSSLLIINNLLKIKDINILNISSGISQNPVKGIGLYGIGKSSSEYLMSVIKKEKPHLKISSFYPGGMNTQMQMTLQDELSTNKSLKDYDYTNLLHQKLYDLKYVAAIIVNHFFLQSNGWEKTISRIYDYE